MKKIHIDELNEGMIIAEDIFSDTTLVIAEGVRLKASHIDYIKYESNYSYVKVNDGDYFSNQFANDQQTIARFCTFSIKYKEAVDQVKEIFLNAKIGGVLLHQEVDEIVDLFLKELEETEDIAGKVWQLYSSDFYTFEHSVQVSVYAMLCGNWLGMDPDEIKELSIAGLLHDIGKCNVPDYILNKTGSLSEEEFKVMRTHAMLGYILLSNTNKYSSSILAGVLQHHERYDGSGYPYGLMKDEIHSFAKIIAVVDVYASMTSNRCYANAQSPFFVIGKLYKRTLGALDPFYTKVFVENMMRHFLGCKVRLSNGDDGTIVFIEKIYPDRPLVKTNSGLINLCDDPDIFVEFVYD